MLRLEVKITARIELAHEKVIFVDVVVKIIFTRNISLETIILVNVVNAKVGRIVLVDFVVLYVILVLYQNVKNLMKRERVLNVMDNIVNILIENVNHANANAKKIFV